MEMELLACRSITVCNVGMTHRTGVTAVTFAFSRKITPFRSRAPCTAAAMSRSSRPMSVGKLSRTVTCVPNEAYIEANSRPI
jgi:hypothetical protein